MGSEAVRVGQLLSFLLFQHRQEQSNGWAAAALARLGSSGPPSIYLLVYRKKIERIKQTRRLVGQRIETENQELDREAGKQGLEDEPELRS